MTTTFNCKTCGAELHYPPNQPFGEIVPIDNCGNDHLTSTCGHEPPPKEPDAGNLVRDENVKWQVKKYEELRNASEVRLLTHKERQLMSNIAGIRGARKSFSRSVIKASRRNPKRRR